MTPLVTKFAALGDPVRLAIAERLLAEGRLSAGQLQDVADISAPAISRHLKVMHQSGLITRTVDKQRRIYAMNRDAVHQIDQWLHSHEAFWRPSLDRLADALKEDNING